MFLEVVGQLVIGKIDTETLFYVVYELEDARVFRVLEYFVGFYGVLTHHLVFVSEDPDVLSVNFNIVFRVLITTERTHNFDACHLIFGWWNKFLQRLETLLSR